jgi:hypothetical protein
MATRRRMDHTLLRVDLNRRCVCPTRRADLHRQSPPPVQPLFFESLLLFYVIFSMFLCCVLVNLNRMELLGVDLFFFSFWFLFRDHSFTITLHLNLHSLLGSLFRCFKRVFILEMAWSINMRRGLGFLDWHSHLHLFFFFFPPL